MKITLISSELSFAVNRTLLSEDVGPFETKRPKKAYAPGFELEAEGNILCPNGGCEGSVKFRVILVACTSENKTFKVSPMHQPLPEDVIDYLFRNAKLLLEKEELFDPFLRTVEYGFGEYAISTTEHRVDCPVCGLTYAATAAHKKILLERALDWVGGLTPANVPIWDENEEGLLPPIYGKRIKPGIVNGRNYPFFGKAVPREEL